MKTERQRYVAVLTLHRVRVHRAQGTGLCSTEGSVARINAFEDLDELDDPRVEVAAPDEKGQSRMRYGTR